MSKTPFKLKSGNSPLFKHMGSSPVKEKEISGSVKDSITGQDLPSIWEGGTSPEAQERGWYIKSKFPKGKLGSIQSDQPAKTEAATPPKKTTPKKGKGKSYADAYAKRDMELYGDLNLADYTTEAKRQQASKTAGKGWDIPTKPMTSAVTDTSEVEETPTVDAGDDVVVEPFKPLVTSRKERRQEKQMRKSSGRLSRKERKFEKLASKAETALAEGKGRKAKRLAKRANRKLRKKGVNTTDAGVGKTSDRLIDLGLG